MISVETHWILVSAAIVVFATMFSVYGFFDYGLSKDLYRGVARQSIAQGIAGLFLTVMALASVWLGYTCATAQPACRQWAVSILVFNQYMVLFSMIAVFVARNRTFHRLGLRRRGPHTLAEEEN